MVHEILTNVMANLTTYFTAAALLVLLYLATHYTQPNIQYLCYRNVKPPFSTRFIIRNFEQMDVKGPIKFKLHADAPFDAPKVFAGPWLKNPSLPDTPQEPEASGGKSPHARQEHFIELKAFPADGVIAIQADTESPSVGLTLSIAEDSVVKPRHFAELPTPPGPGERKRWRDWKRIIRPSAQWLLGLLLGVFLFIRIRAAGLWPRIDKLLTWDLVILAVVGLLSIPLYIFIVSARRQETIAGYRKPVTIPPEHAT